MSTRVAVASEENKKQTAWTLTRRQISLVAEFVGWTSSIALVNVMKLKEKNPTISSAGDLVARLLANHQPNYLPAREQATK